MLRLIDQPKVPLQLGQEAGDDLAAGLVDIDLPTLGHPHRGAQGGEVVLLGYRRVAGQVPGIIQDLRVIEQAQLPLDPQGQLWHPQAHAHFRRGLEEGDGLGAANLSSGADRLRRRGGGDGGLEQHRLLRRQGGLDGQGVAAIVPGHLVANRLRHRPERRFLFQTHHHRLHHHPPGMALQIQARLLRPGGGDEVAHLPPLEAGAHHQPVAQGAGGGGEIPRHHEGVGLIQLTRRPVAGLGLA